MDVALEKTRIIPHFSEPLQQLYPIWSSRIPYVADIEVQLMVRNTFLALIHAGVAPEKFTDLAKVGDVDGLMTFVTNHPEFPWDEMTADTREYIKDAHMIDVYRCAPMSADGGLSIEFIERFCTRISLTHVIYAKGSKGMKILGQIVESKCLKVPKSSKDIMTGGHEWDQYPGVYMSFDRFNEGECIATLQFSLALLKSADWHVNLDDQGGFVDHSTFSSKEFALAYLSGRSFGSCEFVFHFDVPLQYLEHIYIKAAHVEWAKMILPPEYVALLRLRENGRLLSKRTHLKNVRQFYPRRPLKFTACAGTISHLSSAELHKHLVRHGTDPKEARELLMSMTVYQLAKYMGYVSDCNKQEIDEMRMNSLIADMKLTEMTAENDIVYAAAERIGRSMEFDEINTRQHGYEIMYDDDEFYGAVEQQLYDERLRNFGNH